MPSSDRPNTHHFAAPPDGSVAAFAALFAFVLDVTDEFVVFVALESES